MANAGGSIFCILGAAAVVLPAIALAQAPEPSAVPTPATPVIVLPTLTPAPAPTAAPSPEPAALATPAPAAESLPAPRATPTPRRAPIRHVVPEPVASPAPVEQPAAVSPTPRATPRVSATPIAAPPVATTSTPAEGFGWWPWALAAAGLALLALLWTRYQRGVSHNPHAGPFEGEPEEPVASTIAAVHRPSARGPWLTVALRPARAGLNMVTAVADCEITVTNEGSASAGPIRTALTLVAAQGGPVEADSASVEPIVKPLVPAFTLAPGEARTFRGVAAAPLEALPTMQAGGREMLVPLVVFNLQYRDAAGVEHSVSQGFVVGVERADSPKLAPFWLDSLRMFDQVAARPSGAPNRRRLDAEAAGVG